MARHVDYEALIAKLEVTDVFMAIQDDEPVILVICMDCDATILKALGAEVNGAELHLAVLEHDCSVPAAIVVVNEAEEISPYIADAVFEDAEPPAPEGPEITETLEIVATITPRILRLSDRCDRCIAQAWVRVKTLAGEVDLCAHHYHEAALTITAAGYGVVDERAFINAKPSVSATAE